ncbi:flavocytochrome c [Shewanella xiamenensis]|uniref:flavocytochrome c n=1 Tax=Shewanella xiamenensis TaxID=332186 RepID=UPI00313D64AD
MGEDIMAGRRDFLKLATGVTAAMAFPIKASNDNYGRAWDKEFDIIIIGSGFAGLSAAYSAHKAGIKNIIVLEKMEAFGGSSAICGGLMCMPLTPMQKKLGIKDSAELMIKDMLKAGRGFNHPELCRTLATEAHKAYDMLMECGVKFQDKVIRLGGHSAPRAHLPESASGGGIVVPMHNYLRKAGIIFQNRTNVEEVIRGDSGVTGIVVSEKYDFKSGSNRGQFAYKAKKGVIVASGGWGQDHQFIKTTMPAYQELESTAQPGASATMIKSLLSIRALPVMLDMYQLGPWATPDEKGAGPASFFADYAFAEGIAIDPKTGARFMNELADRRTRADAQLAVLASGTKEKPNMPFVFCGEATANHAEGFKAAYRDGAIKKSETLDELAKRYDVDIDALKNSVNEWNEIVQGKAKDPFNKPLDEKTILKPPFYPIRLSPKLHYCMGGVAITPNAEVIDSNTCEPISGLFAAGEVTGGTHGMDRLGGCSSIDGLVFGQIAGNQAAIRKV